ncbi:MAG: FoF1 ATP synthase subunit gamma [Planctomycetota bacterium]
MIGIRQTLQRRKAISNICRLTRTMQIVSTAAFKSHYKKWLAVAEYHQALAQAGYLLITSEIPLEHPLLKDNSSGQSAVLAIGSKTGLCGSYNSAIYEHLGQHIDMAKSAGKKLNVYAPSGRLIGLLHARGVAVEKIYSGLGEIPSDSQIHDITVDFVDRYMAGQLDYFGIVYMAFHSPGRQQAQTMTIMPLADLIDHLTTRAKALWPWDLVFEDFLMSPSPEEIIESLATMIMHTTIKACFLEASLSEHVARMVAMRNATKNAEDMIRELTAEYNRARQTNITSELLDIISGMGVLR